MILMRFSTAYAKESDVYSFSNSTCAYGTSDASPPYTLSELSVHLSFALEFLFCFCSWFCFLFAVLQFGSGFIFLLPKILTYLREHGYLLVSFSFSSDSC